MFPVKSEPSDIVYVGKDSQCIRFMDEHSFTSDILNTNRSEKQSDKSLSEEMLLTVAYLKNESTSNALNYTHSHIKGNKDIYRRQLNDIDIKREKTETCSDSTSGDATVEGHAMMQVHEESQHYNIREHDIHNVTDISQHYSACKSDAIDMGDVCSSIPSQSTIKTHKPIHKRFQCDLCPYSFGRCLHLQKHKLVHSREKPFKCTLCGYRTTQYGHLNRHKLIHTGERPHKCDLCDYSTTRSGHLKTHKLIHTGERPHRCDLCEYSATTSGDLNRHKLIHSGEKPYKCDLCDYSARKSGNLKRHKLVHMGEKPFKCNLFDLSTPADDHLKTHI